LAIEAPLVNALVKIEEDDQIITKNLRAQGEDDQDVSEPTGDSTIGYSWNLK
ncbi:hypothetical protein KI387_003322, partial [Taxus chinensis]